MQNRQWNRSWVTAALLLGTIVGGSAAMRAAAAGDPHNCQVDQVISGPLVVSDCWPECTTLETWTRDVMRIEGLKNASETAQGKAFFRWLRLFSKMAVGGMLQAHEGARGSEDYVLDPHKNLFVYGWGYCDTHSRIAEAAWSKFRGEEGVAERVITQHANGGYHTMYRLRMDGHWGAFDARYGYYLIDSDRPDARVLDWKDVGIDANLLKNRHYRYRSRPYFEGFPEEWERALAIRSTYYHSQADWQAAGAPKECVFGDRQCHRGTAYHDMAFRLLPGTTIERFWDNHARKFYVPERVFEEPFLPSGRFYRVTETMHGGNWVKHDPNYALCAPYLSTVPVDEGYPVAMRGGRTVGQAWGRLIFEPPWENCQRIDGTGVATDFVHADAGPYLRPAEENGGGAAVFDIYCPYVLVDGSVRGTWIASPADQPRVEMRTLQAKPRDRSTPDIWSDWRLLASGPGEFRAALGIDPQRDDAVGIHGVYRFQIRLSLAENRDRQAAAGLKTMRLVAYFENGLMSIPRIQAGRNFLRFKVHDARKIQRPIHVTYNYATPQGPRAHHQVLVRDDFRGNQATYRLDAPELVRCNSLSIRY